MIASFAADRLRCWGNEARRLRFRRADLSLPLERRDNPHFIIATPGFHRLAIVKERVSRAGET
jgi:hypothetical protein